jgi:hypothetical protein
MAKYPTLGGKRCLDPGQALIAARQDGAPEDFVSRANSYRCPLGPEPGEAWVLLARSDLNDLAKNAWHQLKWIDGTRTLTIPSLAIVKSSTMQLAAAGAINAARLVHLHDKRRLMKVASINGQYNIRIPAPSATSGTGLYYTSTLNGGSLWTWQTLLTDIWGNLPSSIRGTAPTLPYSPDGTPEGFRFIGVSAWDALHSVLDKLVCTTSYDPIADEFSYIRLGTTQDGLADSLLDLAKRQVYDYDPEDAYYLGNAPETVRVFFPRKETYHGIEKDTPDSDNWELTPAVSKDYATGLTGAESGTVWTVWDDLSALYNSSGSNTNSADLQTRADEIGANIANRLSVSDERYRTIFGSLVLDVLPGSEVSEVVWRDYGDETGLVTEVIRRPLVEQPPSDVALVGDLSGRPATVDLAEQLKTFDFARNQHPLYPRVAQLVQVDDGASATGADLTANGDGLFPGFVIRWADGAYTQLEDCWIRPADLEGVNEALVSSLKQKDRMVGRLAGVETSGGSTYPVYLVRKGDGGTDSPMAIVRVTDGSGTACSDTVSEDLTRCVVPGFTATFDPLAAGLCPGSSPYTDTALDIWIANLDHCEEGHFLWRRRQYYEKDLFLGMLVGTFDLSGDERPLYIIRDQTLEEHIFFGEAVENWRDNAGGSCATVTVRPRDDCTGATGTTSQLTVYLPRAGDKDPNVCQDDIIAIHHVGPKGGGSTNTYMCVSDYLDDKIGTVKMWTGDVADIPCGWAIMNGSANAAPEGSGIDMTDRFVKAGLTANQQGGTGQHSHEIDVRIDSTTAIELAQVLQNIQGLFTVNIPDHTVDDLDHEHNLDAETPSTGWETDSITWTGAVHAQWTPDKNRRVGCTDGPTDADGSCTGGAWGPLDHDGATIEVKYPGSAGTGGGAAAINYTTASTEIYPAEHIPPFKTLIFIERINNAADFP